MAMRYIDNLKEVGGEAARRVAKRFGPDQPQLPNVASAGSAHPRGAQFSPPGTPAPSKAPVNKTAIMSTETEGPIQGSLTERNEHYARRFELNSG